MKEEKRGALDTFLTVAIFLVLIQTFFEEIALMAYWPAQVRGYLACAGFAFDLLFTIEFLVRWFTALGRKAGGDYFFRRRGWVDFLAALPLLLFDSGPRVYVLSLGGSLFLAGGGALNMLKAVKAIRLARVLRFLRVLKLFRNIKYVDSSMAQRHLTRLSTIAVSTVVFAALVYGFFVSVLHIPTPTGVAEAEQNRFLDAVDENVKAERYFEDLFHMKSDLLLVRDTDKDLTLYTRFNNDYYRRHFDVEDYRVAEKGSHAFFFDIRDARATSAAQQLLVFSIVVLLLIALLFLYGPHFAVTVTDPVHVMRRGYEEPDYNLEVRIPSRYSGDDLFILSRLYNETYLPMKIRERTPESREHSALTLKSLGDLNGLK